MQIQLDQQYKKLVFIKEIRPGKLKYLTIFILVFLSILLLGLPLFLYLKWQKFKNFVHLTIFQEVEKDTDDVNHYLIVDSKKFQGQSRQIIYRNKIITPFLVQRDQNSTNQMKRNEQQQILCKYFEHKNLRYVIKNHTLQSLKYSIKKPISEYISRGLQPKQMTQNTKIYGKAQSFKISFFDIFLKILYQKHLRTVLMLFAIKKIIVGFIQSSKQQKPISDNMTSIFMLSQILLTLMIMAGVSIMGSANHNKVHKNIEDQVMYEVVRQGQKINVKLGQLLVGDIVHIKINQVIYFKGLLVGNKSEINRTPLAMVNQKLYNRIDQPQQKIALANQFIEPTQRNIIHPGTLIINILTKSSNTQQEQQLPPIIMQKKSQSLNITKQRSQERLFRQAEQDLQNKQKSMFIIVTDNNFIQKFYHCYSHVNYYDNFQSIFKSYDREQIIMSTVFVIFYQWQLFFALGFTIILALNQHTNEHWFDIFLSNLVLCFPFNFALFCNVSELVSIVRLYLAGVTVVNPVIQQVGLADNISLQLSAFETLQFVGYIKKERCNLGALPDRYQNNISLFDIFRRARQQSILSFLLWAGMMNLQRMQSQPLYKQIFKQFEFQFKKNDGYGQEQSNKPIVQNLDQQTIKVRWSQFQRFPMNQKLMQTLIVQDSYLKQNYQTRFIIISQGEYLTEECQHDFERILNEVGRQRFLTLLRQLYEAGKKIKYLCIRRNFIRNQEDARINRFVRSQIQTKLQFGGFLIFDEWPSESALKVLIELDRLEFQCPDSGVQVNLFSVRKQNSLVGYDHILRHSVILFSQMSDQRVRQLQFSRTKFEGVLYTGNGIIDQGAMLMSDISVNKINESYGQADFQINKPEQLLNVIHEGAWSLYCCSLTFICLVLFNFSKIIGQLIIFSNNSKAKIQSQPFETSLNGVFTIDIGSLMIPLILLNLYEPVKKLTKKDNKKLFRIQLLIKIGLSLVGLVMLYTIEFLDHGFAIDSCILNQNDKRTDAHMLFSRKHQIQRQFQNNYEQCQGIINFLTLSFAFLVILIFDRQSPERKARNIFIGLVNKVFMFGIWILSIVHFHIPRKNIIRSIIVIIALTAFSYLEEYLRTQKEKLQLLRQENNQVRDSQILR